MQRKLIIEIEIIQTATAHALSEDDEYDGYFIPKGATIVANAWYVD